MSIGAFVNETLICWQVREILQADNACEKMSHYFEEDFFLIVPNKNKKKI